MRSRGDGKSGQTGARDRIQFDTLLELWLNTIYVPNAASFPHPRAARAPRLRVRAGARRGLRGLRPATGGPARGRGPGGSRSRRRAITLSYYVVVDARPAWWERTAYSYGLRRRPGVLQRYMKGRATRTTSVYPNAKQDAYYQEFVSHSSHSPSAHALPDGRLSQRHTDLVTPSGGRAMCERVKPRAVSACVLRGPLPPRPPPCPETPVDPAGRPDPIRTRKDRPPERVLVSGSVDAVQMSFSSKTTLLRAPLEVEFGRWLAALEVVFELLEERLDARARKLRVDSKLGVAALEQVSPRLGKHLHRSLELRP